MENFDIDQLGDTGYTGKNVCVCVLDTGIYPHIDFRILWESICYLMMTIPMEPM